MADRDFQVILKHVNGMPEDSYVNTLHFHTAFPDTVEGTCDGIAAAYNANIGLFASQIAAMTIKAYPPGLNPAGPEFQKDYVFNPANGESVAEVALCLSYASVDDPETSTPRRRGRIYLGPLDGGRLGFERPLASLQALALDLGEDLATIGFGTNTTWKLKSQTDQSYHDIESIWVDNAWDTQRRRGLKPTARVVRDVQ